MPTIRRLQTCGAGHERRPLGGALPRGDLRPRPAGARAPRLLRRRGRVEHRREHDPRRRRPAHPRRQADRRRLAGSGRRGRARRDDGDEQLGPRRRRRRDAHQERHRRPGRAGRPPAERGPASSHRGVEPARESAGAGRRAHVRDGRPRRARGADGERPRGGGRHDEPVLQPVVRQPADDELLDAAAHGRRASRSGGHREKRRLLTVSGRGRDARGLGRCPSRFTARRFRRGWPRRRHVVGPRGSRGRDPQRRGGGRSTVFGRFAFYRPRPPRQATDRRQVRPDPRWRPGRHPEPEAIPR